MFESLESRLHLSVTRDSNGFTVVNPSADSRIVYISASGSDSNPGTINAPVKSVEGARALLNIATAGSAGAGARNNVPDQILFRRGDVFNDRIDNWATSGRSADEPFLIGAYTDPNQPSSERPRIHTGINTAFDNQASASAHPPVSNVYIMGIAFEAHNRNYRQPTANFTISYKTDAQGGSYGINLYGAVTNFWVEDASFQYFRAGMVAQAANGWGTLGNITVRRSNLSDNYAPSYDATGKYITSEGIYADGIQTLTLEENVFDHNGWTDPAYGNFGTFATIYNHNVYLNIGNNNVTIRNNIFANAASHGLQARAGGVVKDNVFINNPIGMSYGYLNGMEKPGGVYGEISGNVTYGGSSINGQPRGWGLEIGNLRPASQGGGTIVKNNIYATYNGTGTGALWPAIHLTYGVNANNPQDGVGINDLTLQKNIVYGWTKGLYINSGFNVGGNSRYGFNNVQYLDNEFQSIHHAPMVEHGPNYSASQETWRGNRYDMAGSDSGATNYFQIKSTQLTMAQWQSLAEPTASAAQINYPNPNVSPASYSSSLGGGGSIAAYLTQAKQQSSRFWRTSYAPTALLKYMRAGFSGGVVEEPPPPTTVLQANATRPNITSNTTSPLTVTVSYSDSSGVAAGTLDNNDIQIQGPNGFVANASLISRTGAGTPSDPMIVTYSFPPPAGGFKVANNGTYFINLRANQVTSGAGVPATGGTIGSFEVEIDFAAPSSVSTTPSVFQASTSTTQQITVVFSDPSGVNVGSIGTGDLIVQRPNGSTATPALQSVSGSGTSITATFALSMPGGITNAAAGDYVLTLGGNGVSDNAGNVTAAGQTAGTFRIDLDSDAPTASFSFGDILEQNEDFTVFAEYIDDPGVAVNTIDNNDLRVVGPNGFNQPLELVDANFPEGNYAYAIYVLKRPEGGWKFSHNGQYDLVVQPNQVKDVSGNTLPSGVAGSFKVNVDAALQGSIDDVEPNPAPKGLDELTIRFNQSVSNFDISKVRFTRDGGGNLLTGAQRLTTSDGINFTVSGLSSLTQVDGIYELRVPQTDSVTGQYGWPLYEDVVLTFRVDARPPTFTVNASDLNSATNAPYTFSVTWTDDSVLDMSKLSDGDVRVSGPNGYSVVAKLVSLADTSSKTSRTATYSVTAPAGGWSAAANGGYEIHVRDNEVADVSGNHVAAQQIGTFNVNVSGQADVTAPTTTIVAVSPNPRNSAVSSIGVNFSEAVSGFDLSDLTLTRDGGANLLTGGQSLTSGNNQAFSLTNLTSVTATSGTYTLTLKSSGTGITDLSGNSLAGGASTTWTVTATVPPTTPPTNPPTTPPTNPPPTVPPAVPAGPGVNINFQPSNAPAVSGYLIDAGQAYGARNGQSYGWTTNHTDAIFDRNGNGDQLLDTVASVKNGAKWELAVPNGTYTVLVGVGDAAAASTNNVWVEGINFYNYESLPTNAFANKSLNVTVSDGKLTMGFGSAPTGTVKLDFIQVYSSSPPTVPPPPQVPPPPPPPAPTFGVSGLTLVNADNDTEIGLVASGQTIQVGSPNINLHAVTTGSIGSVRFLIDGQEVKVESEAPYSIGGDAAPDFQPWAAPAGTHTIKVIPYSGPGLTGEIGSAYEVSLTFRNPTVPPPPTSPPPTSPPTGTVRVNFQPAAAPTVAGYIVDAGAIYGTQNGYTYGWSTSHGDAAVDRNINANQIIDTNIGVKAKARWDFALPNGTYTVKVGVGDAGAASRNNIWVEGSQNILQYQALAANQFTSQTTTVNVTDGKLTIGVGGAATGETRIDYIELAGDGLVGTSPPPTSPPPTSPPPTSPPPTAPPPPPASGTVKVNFQPSAAPTASGYLVDAGLNYGTRNGYSYGWSTSHTDAVVDRNINANQVLDTNVGVKATARWEMALPNGTYTVKVGVGDAGVASRNNIWLEGSQNILQYVTLAANQFTSQTTTINVTDGKLTIGIGGAATSETRIDYIEVTGDGLVGTSPPASVPPTVVPLNNGFEAPNLSGGFQYNPAGGTWTFVGSAGVTGNGNAFTSANSAAPQGSQVAFLQTTGTISQTVSNWTAGKYQVTFKAAQRANHGTRFHDFAIYVDGQKVGTFTPSGIDYSSYSSDVFTVSAGAHQIQFVGINTNGTDQTSLIDDVLIVGRI